MDIMVLNSNLFPLEIIDSYESLIWVDRYNKYGDFELVIALENITANLVTADNILVCSESKHIMIIDDVKIVNKFDSGIFVTITGKSGEHITDRRIVWGLKTINTNLYDAVHDLLIQNISMPTNTDRQIDIFVNIPSEQDDEFAIRSLTINQQFTGDNLYTLISGLCDETGVGYRVTISEDGTKLEAQLYLGKNRSYNQDVNPYVVFSPKYDNLVSGTYIRFLSGFKNVALIGGEGDGSYRTYTNVGSGSGLNRRELFVDARDLSSSSEEGELTPAQYIQLLRQRGYSELYENGIIEAFDGEIDTKNTFTLGVDFDLGDIIQIENEFGHSTAAQVVEVIISQNSEGLKIYPTVKTV